MTRASIVFSSSFLARFRTVSSRTVYFSHISFYYYDCYYYFFFLPIYILKKEKDEINFGLRPSIFVDQKSEKLFYKRLYFPHRMVGE